MKMPPEKKAADLARACRVRAPSVSDWLSGKTKKMEGANLLLAAEFLNVDPWWLATGEGQMERRANAPAPQKQEKLGAHAQALVDALTEADKVGLPSSAFVALLQTLKVFEDLRGQQPNDLLDLNGPDPEEA
ncbi:helix-turn-helix transcriptional regulator [Burkholderia multivorans]|uniref:helix-turn-helix domain-containing protein n=1 Tax=Burkholderia cepacia complex TaxID=87882 RepID=UPI001D016373|nr:MULTISPECIES: helix-turn-helix transcriptional regulator [Burkholderia cepacia complex]MCO1435977.1 helix-turn-helix transcriptional regulator [Burkholderia multivorans]UQN61672.1 helix-turn-helix transcriptional regulator [Burkholderia multivorans]UQN65017.1 helix-turn-helix transcriptional regulator [Burkholderia multivorans]UQO07485.1 helix-turn-helix transcriptional regulator [Burkholderia multivorans]UQO26482.1 helix-turn-helix transcriptional regulator [Burkholderia multivorans]